MAHILTAIYVTSSGKGLQLTIIYYQLISWLFSQSERLIQVSKKCAHHDPRVTSSDRLFCPTDSPKGKDT